MFERIKQFFGFDVEPEQPPAPTQTRIRLRVYSKSGNVMCDSWVDGGDSSAFAEFSNWYKNPKQDHFFEFRFSNTDSRVVLPRDSIDHYWITKESF